jgi:hypothetical protein
VTRRAGRCRRPRGRRTPCHRPCGCAERPWRRRYCLSTLMTGPRGTHSAAVCPIGRANAGVVVRGDQLAIHRADPEDARHAWWLGPRPLEPLSAGSGSRVSQSATFGDFLRGRRRPKPGYSVFKSRSGAGDGVRTLDPTRCRKTRSSVLWACFNFSARPQGSRQKCGKHCHRRRLNA